MDLVRCDHVRALAEQYCGPECQWYHGNWELLKSLGVVSTSALHAGELGELVARALPVIGPRPRVLLSGSTDDSLLRILLASAGDMELEITALDICATPLKLTGEYAAARGLALECVRSDILSYSRDRPFDLILTHAFMGNFDAAGRRRLVQKWSSLLSESGRVVTMQRVRAADSPELVKFSPEQAVNFVQAALDAATRAGDNQQDLLPRVEKAADLFARRFVSHAITSKFELEKAFRDADMRFQHLEYRTMVRTGSLAGPSVPSGGEYALMSVGRGHS